MNRVAEIVADAIKTLFLGGLLCGLSMLGIVSGMTSNLVSGINPSPLPEPVPENDVMPLLWVHADMWREDGFAANEHLVADFKLQSEGETVGREVYYGPDAQSFLHWEWDLYGQSAHLTEWSNHDNVSFNLTWAYRSSYGDTLVVKAEWQSDRGTEQPTITVERQ